MKAVELNKLAWLKVINTYNSYDFIINTLNMYAIFECEERSIYLRNAKIKNKLYHDLTNQKYEVVEISDQTWKIITSNKVLFKRYNDQKPQCYPKRGGKIKKLFDYVNIKSDKLLFIVYLISCFIEDIQHPLLILHGESGHGKSTVSKILKELIDPNRYNLLSIPKKEEDFFLNMERNWFVPFDNISKISEEMSNNLCKVVTGIAIPKRKIYTINDIYIIDVQRCLVINGIENCAWKEDLLNRALIYEVKKDNGITTRPNNELFADFEKEKPFLLGDIFEILSITLEIIKDVDLNNILKNLNFTRDIRMAEFAKWGYAIAEAMGGKGSKFLQQYKNNIDKQINEAIDSNTLVSAVKIFINEQDMKYWEGRPSDLLEEIKRVAVDECLNTNSLTMPKSAPEVTRKLNAYKGTLEKAGICYDHHGHKNAGAFIILSKIEN